MIRLIDGYGLNIQEQSDKVVEISNKTAEFFKSLRKEYADTSVADIASIVQGMIDYTAIVVGCEESDEEYKRQNTTT